jgi:hypothetical protein
VTRRAVIEDPAGALTRTCPDCCVEPAKPCRTPSGKPFKRGNRTTHRRRQVVPAPLSHLAVTSQGHGHVRNAKRGAHGLCGRAVTLDKVPNTVRVECRDCYSLKAHMTAHPERAWPQGVGMLPLAGGVPEDATV